MENHNDQAPQSDDEIIDVTEIIARLEAVEKLAASHAAAHTGLDDRCREIEAKVTELVEYCNSLGDDSESD